MIRNCQWNVHLDSMLESHGRCSFFEQNDRWTRRQMNENEIYFTFIHLPQDFDAVVLAASPNRRPNRIPLKPA